MNDIGKIAHVLKHSHGRCIIGSFDKYLHEGSIWTGYRAVLSFILHKSIFLYFVHNGTIFYDKYMSSKHRKTYLMMMEVEFSPNNRLERSTIQNINLLIQIAIMLWKILYKRYKNTSDIFRNKMKGNMLCFNNWSPYHDAKGSPQLRSYHHDAIVNSAPRIGGKWTNKNYIDNVCLEGWCTQQYKSWKNVNVYHL